MKVAVTYENGEVFQHFGHSEAFKLYEVEGGEVKSSEVVPTNGSGHGALAGFLRERGVERFLSAEESAQERRTHLQRLVSNCMEEFQVLRIVRFRR